MPKFYLGVHRPHWLWADETRDIPLFVSHRQLKGRKGAFPKATTRWSLDSGGFTELSTYGEWRTKVPEYVTAVQRYSTELGGLDWASPQDWMCEPWIIEKTGLSVEEHQRRTVQNYLDLRAAAPDLPWIPVLQGWSLDDYLRCVYLYWHAGVDLREAATVGVGSVCRRQSTDEIGEIFGKLRSWGLTNLHGFGVKKAGVRLYGRHLSSADSMSWSYRARMAARDREAVGLSGSCNECTKKNCANCLHFALEWRERIMKELVT